MTDNKKAKQLGKYATEEVIKAKNAPFIALLKKLGIKVATKQ